MVQVPVPPIITSRLIGTYSNSEARYCNGRRCNFVYLYILQPQRYDPIKALLNYSLPTVWQLVPISRFAFSLAFSPAGPATESYPVLPAGQVAAAAGIPAPLLLLSSSRWLKSISFL